MILEYNKYKRIFAFGCSFTRYIYPTWAEIIANEMPLAEYYNFGESGGGNLFIAARIVEANLRFNFCETDLVMVMYSTSFREDRYLNNKWETHGHIYSQGFYPIETFVEPYCQPKGMLIRDLPMITASTDYLKRLSCDTFLLRAAPIKEECKNDKLDEELIPIIELYKPVLDSFPPSLYEVEFSNGWRKGITIIDNGKSHVDHHPLTNDYYNYLKKIGLNLTDRSEKFIEETNLTLNKYYNVERKYYEKAFPKISDTIRKTRLLMF